MGGRTCASSTRSEAKHDPDDGMDGLPSYLLAAAASDDGDGDGHVLVVEQLSGMRQIDLQWRLAHHPGQ